MVDDLAEFASIDLEVNWDGDSVWVNGRDGCCLGRFGRRGVDVHRTGAGQVTGLGQCLDCHPDASADGWRRFCASMLEHHNVSIPEDAKPGWLQDEKTPRLLEVARRLFSRFGVRACVMDEVPDECQAPFSTDLGVRDNRVLCTAGADAAEFIHEAAHVVFGLDESETVWDHVDALDEGEFFAWEWRVAVWLGIERTWRESNAGYILDGVQFGLLSDDEQTAELRRLLGSAPREVLAQIAKIEPVETVLRFLCPNRDNCDA